MTTKTSEHPRTADSESSLGHFPKGSKWEFDESVALVFDDMLRRSIPQYDLMRESVHEIARRHVKRGTDIVDLGCSRGEQLSRLVEEFGAYNRFVAVDVSAPMLEATRKRFEGYVKNRVVDVRHCDLRHDFPPCQASVILSVLTLQFTPIEYRRRIVEAARDHLIDGGAFILVEKVFGRTAQLDRLMESVYLEFKMNNGYTEEEVARKKLSLEGVLVPMDAGWNYQMLRESRFTGVECFWRWMNFAAWVAVR